MKPNGKDLLELLLKLLSEQEGVKIDCKIIKGNNDEK